VLRPALTEALRDSVAALLQGERELYERTLKRSRFLGGGGAALMTTTTTLPKQGVRAAMPMMQANSVGNVAPFGRGMPSR
jgi:hypothetical protein